MSLRTSLRSLAHAPGYAVASIALLALGIGATSGIFRAVDAVLFHPIVAPDPDRLVRILRTDQQHHEIGGNSSAPVFRDYRDGSKSFSGLAAFSDWITLHVAHAGAAPERVVGGVASGDFFSVLGAHARLGRLLGPGDDRAGAEPVALLSDDAWRLRFGRDPEAVGTTVTVNGHAVTIVGVLERGFRGPNLLSPNAELWLPLAQTVLADPEWAEVDPLENRNFFWVDLVGRLAPGVTIAAAQSELDAIAANRAKTQTEDDRDPWPFLAPAAGLALDDGGDGAQRTVALLLLALSATLLVAAVANAAGLGLARALARRREMAVRSAIGAGRARVIAETALESALLVGGGALLAPIVASATIALLRSKATGLALPLDFAADAGDLRAVAVTGAVALLAALLFTLAPALASGRVDLTAALKSDAGSASTDSVLGSRAPRFRLRRLLVALQAAVAMALLVGAALFLRTLERAIAVPLGFSTDGVVIASLDFGKQGLDTAGARRAIDQVVQRLAAAPGIESAASASHVPVYPYGMRMTMRPEGYTFADGEDEGVNLTFASPGLFSTLSIPVVAGRDFGAADAEGAPPVVIVNQAFVRKYFRDGVAVGKSLLDSNPKESRLVGTVVGVVGDVRERSVRGDSEPLFYIPQAQRGRSRTFVVARATPGAEAAALATLRATVAGIDPLLPVHKARTLAEHVAEALATERTLAALVSVAAAATLALVIAGLVAVTALAVRARRREFGVRAALGAPAALLARGVASEAVALVAAGALAGGIAAAFGSRFVGSLLFGVERLDPASYLGAGAALVVASLAAVLPFARRAARVDPAAALRCE